MTAKPLITSTDDAMAIIYSGTLGRVVHLHELPRHFFELENRLAGDVFQKFTNYRYPLAIVIPPNHSLGQRATELMLDHKHHPYIRFFHTAPEADQWIQTHDA